MADPPPSGTIWVLLARRRWRKKAKAPSIVSAPTDTPTPTPTFAPVERPEEESGSDSDSDDGLRVEAELSPLVVVLDPLVAEAEDDDVVEATEEV